MSEIKLSDKTKAVCKAFYENNCQDCPIRQPCVKPFVRTREQLEQNIIEINAAAEKVILNN